MQTNYNHSNQWYSQMRPITNPQQLEFMLPSNEASHPQTAQASTQEYQANPWMLGASSNPQSGYRLDLDSLNLGILGNPKKDSITDTDGVPSSSVSSDQEYYKSKKGNSFPTENTTEYTSPSISPSSPSSYTYNHRPPLASEPSKQGSVRSKRSRMGCLTCRSRKRRCCETKPKCHECSRLGLNCTWPSPGSERRNKPRNAKEAEGLHFDEFLWSYQNLERNR